MPAIFRDKSVLDKMRPRIKYDVYETPYKLASACVNLLPKIYHTVLDIGAGSGIWGKAVREASHITLITGIDVRAELECPPNYDFWFRENYLEWDNGNPRKREYDLIIGNPPFNLAEKFIMHSRQFLNNWSIMGLLLPSTFQHTVGRGRGLFKEYKPNKIYSLMQRPNFTGPNGESLGKANTDDYIFMVWLGKINSSFCQHDWLDWK